MSSKGKTLLSGEEFQWILILPYAIFFLGGGGGKKKYNLNCFWMWWKRDQIIIKKRKKEGVWVRGGGIRTLIYINIFDRVEVFSREVNFFGVVEIVSKVLR